jgi:hypothetical protein
MSRWRPRHGGCTALNTRLLFFSLFFLGWVTPGTAKGWPLCAETPPPPQIKRTNKDKQKQTKNKTLKKQP